MTTRDPERDAEILRLLDEGLTGAAIAKRVGCSPSTVTKAKRRAGRPVVDQRRDWSVLDRTLIALYREGATLDRISEQLGVSTAAARDRLKRLGYSRERVRRIVHGIPARWQEGCRCEACVRSMREYKRAEHERNLLAGAVTHGPSGWSRGCRCKTCVTAMRDQSTQRQNRTRRTAISSHEPWTDDEDQAVLDRSQRIEDIATALGRTYSAVDNRRRHLRRKMGDTPPAAVNPAHVCRISRCSRPVQARGVCGVHYGDAIRRGRFAAKQRRWTEAEDNLVRNPGGLSNGEVARQLDRTPGAVYRRRSILRRSSGRDSSQPR